MERYGTIPPRFTKAWFSHYWYYYKFHFMAGIIIIAVVGSVIRSCVTAIDYDLQVQCLSGGIISDESVALLEARVAELSGDANENGKVQTQVYQQVSMGDGPEAAQYNYAITMKITAELQTGDMGIYIMDKTFADTMAQYECFIPVSEWAEDFSEESLYNDSILSLAGNEAFDKMGINTEDLYIGVLSLYERNADKKHMTEKHENAVNTARLLIKG